MHFFHWSQLSFLARVMINAGVVLLISAVALLYFSTRHEADFVRMEMSQQLESELDALRVSLTDAVVLGDYATLEQVMATRLKRDHLTSISWTDAKGFTIAVSEPEAVSDAPRWFVDWIGVQRQSTALPFEIGGRIYGTISGDYSPVAHIDRLWWNTFLVHLAILALAVGLDFLGIMFILKRGLRPLGLLADGAHRFGTGDLSARIPQQGPPELQHTIAAFNQMASKVQIQSERLKAIFGAATDFAIIAVDMSGRILLFNTGAERMLKYNSETMEKGSSMSQLFAAEEFNSLPDSSEARSYSLLMIMSGGGAAHDWQMVRSDGEKLTATIAVNAIRNSSGGVDGYLLMAQDVTAQRAAERQLLIAAAAFETQEGMMVTDVNGIIQRVNGAFTRLTGYSADDAIGQPASLLKSGRQDQAFYQEMWDTLLHEHHWRGEIWNRRKNGEVFPEWLSISAVTSANGTISHYVSSFTDISERKEAEERIQYLAYYDSLTQLPNRRLLHDRLGQAIAASARSMQWGAALFIDLDHFKTLNDTKGHEIGDQLLIEVAQRIHGRVREGDTVARLGADEFVVILSNLHAERSQAAAYADQIALMIGLGLGEPYNIKGYKHHATASIGVALFNGEGCTPGELLKRADIAMYEAKSAGRNCVRFFEPDMQEALDSRLAMESELRQAISAEEFELFYQVQIGSDDTVIGAEVLLRWHHPQRGIIPPGHFIPVAEESGLIVPLGHWVVENACRRLKAWEDIPQLEQLQLSVNVSARQFRHHDFVEQVLAIVDYHKVTPSRLKLELTESMVLDDMADSVRKMERLKSHGISFAMDDFGTGHSSLAYLKQLPLDQMKIDQSFVRDIVSDPGDAVLVKTIIAMGRSLGLDVIAEGVETEAQRLYLENHGCGAFQGYLFSRPLTVGDFEQLVSIRSGRPVLTTGWGAETRPS